jgi:hypothetical protein
MFEDPEGGRPDAWQEQRMIKLRQMASALRTRAARRPPGPANTLRQTAVELERSANRLEAVISRPA